MRPDRYYTSGNKQIPFYCNNCHSDDVKQTWLNGTMALLKCNHCGNKGRNIRREGVMTNYK
jgi:hypothetical protein